MDLCSHPHYSRTWSLPLVPAPPCTHMHSHRQQSAPTYLACSWRGGWGTACCALAARGAPGARATAVPGLVLSGSTPPATQQIFTQYLSGLHILPYFCPFPIPPLNQADCPPQLWVATPVRYCRLSSLSMYLRSPSLLFFPSLTARQPFPPLPFLPSPDNLQGLQSPPAKPPAPRLSASRPPTECRTQPQPLTSCP